MQPTDQYRELFERSADAILIIEGDTFVDCNQATVDMLRYRSKADLLQTHPSELSPERQPDGRLSYEKANEMIAIAFAHGSHRFEWDHRRADGEVFPVEVLLTAVPKGDQKILHVVWRDITDRKRLEAELRQAQKMEAVGRLTGGIAHDFNNLLVAVLGHAELLKLQLGNDPALLDHVIEIQHAGQRAAELVGRLLAFSRGQVLQPKVLDLNAALVGLDGLLRRLLGEDVQVSTRLSPTPLFVKADPGQLDQVILNLATNARDAMPGGGALHLETSKLVIDEHTIGVDAGLGQGSYAVLVVSDTGAGMDERTRERIFEPFFTTKGPGAGTGLGLATVYGIVKQSGGEVTVLTEVGKGSVFRVFLPLTDEEPQSLPEPAPATPGAERRPATETILLVEDDPAVGSLMEEVLRLEGYAVVRARHGEEALSLIDERGLRFDLLLTDVVLPRMGGPELVSRLRARSPGRFKVLYASGYTDSALTHRGVLDAEVQLLPKPFSPGTLLHRVRDVLDQEPSGR